MPYVMDATERREILTRYLDHVRRFDEVAARRNRGNGTMAGEVVQLKSPARKIEQEPTPRERQVLQLIADGLVNREIGVELYSGRLKKAVGLVAGPEQLDNLGS